MYDVIKEQLSSVSIVTLIPIVFLFFKTGIDAFTMQSVEKVFLPLSKRLSIFLSTLSLLSILIGLVYYFILSASGSTTLDYIFLFGLPIIILFIGIVVASIIFTIIHVGSLKVSFLFKDEEGDIWKIERAVNKSTILAFREKGKYRFFDLKSVKQKELTKELNERRNIFGQKHLSKHLKKYLGGIVFIYLLLAFLPSFVSMDDVTLLIYVVISSLLFTVLGCYLLIIYNNQNLLKEFPE